MKKSNFHTHTKFCDGSDKPETYIIEAIKLGFDSLGFSGHAPISYQSLYIQSALFINMGIAFRGLGQYDSS